MTFSYIDNSTDVQSNYNRFFQETKFFIERHVPIKECSGDFYLVRKNTRYNMV